MNSPDTQPGPAVADRLAGQHSSAVRELLAHAREPGMISFAGGLPGADGFDSDAINEAMAQALAQPRVALQYSYTEGEPVLRAQLAQLMANRGVALSSDSLIVTTGSQQGIDLVARLLLNAGDTVLVERPAYLAALSVFKLAQCQLLGVASDAHGLQVDTLDNALAQCSGNGWRCPRLLYVVPEFANPSGVSLSASRRVALLEWAARNRIVILEDDPYGALRFSGSSTPSLLSLCDTVPQARPWLIHLSSLSKVVAPALRIGWLALPQSLYSNAVIVKQNLDLHTSTVCQLAAAHYLAAGRLGQRLDVLRNLYRQRKQAMASALTASFGNEVSFNDPSGGMFLWARLQAVDDSHELLPAALTRRVMYVPGAEFYDDEPDRSALRLSFATGTPDQIAEGVRRLHAAVTGR